MKIHQLELERAIVYRFYYDLTSHFQVETMNEDSTNVKRNQNRFSNFDQDVSLIPVFGQM